MANLLVLAETDGQHILDSTLPTLTFAQQYAQAGGGGFDLLIIGGADIAANVESWRGWGAEKVLVVSVLELAHPTADRVAGVLAKVAQSTAATALAAPSSSFGRDVLPRAAALLDLPMLSDVLSVEDVAGSLHFRRPMYAGNIIATVQVADNRGAYSVRGTAFEKPKPAENSSALEVVELDAASLPTGTMWQGLEAGEQKRPDLTSARVVVSGGRPLRDAETFERLLGGLADKLGGAVGATRAAVDSGIAPNELQVGQTGKIVAPELYIAAGVSGSVQHLAGMKESKIIVAINTDPEAPIFEVADYGLVADLHQALPELTQKLG